VLPHDTELNDSIVNNYNNKDINNSNKYENGNDLSIISNNNNEVLLSCIGSLQNYFLTSKWQLNQPILLKDLYILLDRISGVQTVKNISISNKAGTTSGYSQYAYDIVGATQNQVIYPSLDPSIFEVRYPNTDIKGKVVPL
jgi:hypothetical protein